MSKYDRKVIVHATETLLENPDEHGIFHTSTFYAEVEMHMEAARLQAAGWMLAEVCSMLDEGKDPRTAEVPQFIESMRAAFP